jgi:hypothetical protein
MTTKYITASLVIVLSILDMFIPRFLDLMSCDCTTARTKTTRSTGTDRAPNRRNGAVIRKSGDVLTEEKRYGHLGDCPESPNLRKTHVIQVQRNHIHHDH